MSHEKKLARAIEIAREILDGPGDNPDYFVAWQKTKAEWQALYDAEEFEKGADVARDKFRHLFVECSDWAEHKEPYGGGPWSRSASRFRGYMNEIDALCPLGT